MSFFADFYIKYILGQEVYHGKSLKNLFPKIDFEEAWKSYLSNYIYIRDGKREQDKIAKRNERKRKAKRLLYKVDDSEEAFDKIQFEEYEKEMIISSNSKKLLSILPAKQRLAFQLHLEDYKQVEIAKKMGISPSAVNHLLSKVKDK